MEVDMTLVVSSHTRKEKVKNTLLGYCPTSINIKKGTLLKCIRLTFNTHADIGII